MSGSQFAAREMLGRPCADSHGSFARGSRGLGESEEKCCVSLSWAQCTEMAVVQNQWHHFGSGAILEPIWVGIGIFIGGTVAR